MSDAYFRAISEWSAASRRLRSCTDCTSPAEVTDCRADTGDRCGPCHVASCAECQDGLADQDAAESRSDGRWS